MIRKDGNVTSRLYYDKATAADKVNKFDNNRTRNDSIESKSSLVTNTKSVKYIC